MVYHSMHGTIYIFLSYGHFLSYGTPCMVPCYPDKRGFTAARSSLNPILSQSSCFAIQFCCVQTICLSDVPFWSSPEPMCSYLTGQLNYTDGDNCAFWSIKSGAWEWGYRQLIALEYTTVDRENFAVKIISQSRPTAKIKHTKNKLRGDDQWISLRASPHSPR